MEDLNEFGEKRRPIKEMRKTALLSLGKWIKLKNRNTVLHLESDVPYLRVYCPKKQEIKLIDMDDIESIAGDIIIPS